jgi:hypothetical protein
MGPGGSPWILLVQGCLRKLFGPGATPMDATLGPQTRRALSVFQQQNGLPPTGDLDNATVQALQAACMGPSAAPPDAGGAPPPDAGAAGGPPPDAGGAPPDAGGAGAAPDGGAPPPDAGAAGGAPPADGAAPPQGEIMLGRREGDREQEFLVDGPARVELAHGGPLPLEQAGQLPDAPGLYIIRINNAVWYVGIAELSIRNRFQQRFKVLRDLQVPNNCLTGRTVEWYLLRMSSVARGAIQRKDADNPRALYRPLSGKYAILRVLEQHFIKGTHPQGNVLTEAVQFSPRGSLAITVDGAQAGSYPPNSRI